MKGTQYDAAMTTSDDTVISMMQKPIVMAMIIAQIQKETTCS